MKSFRIRPTQALDVDLILSILIEVASRVPINLSTNEHIKAIREQIVQDCRAPFSLAAVNENEEVIGFLLARKINWLDEEQIHLRYAGVTAKAEGMGVFKKLIEREKQNGLPLVVEVKPDNDSRMVNRIMKYDFRPDNNANMLSEYFYRWAEG